MSASSHELPRTAECNGATVELRAMTADDQAAVLAFAHTVPEHDLLFLRRDITQPKVVAAWAQAIETGDIFTVLAWSGDEVVGCAAVVRDRLSWSGHVAELRVLVSSAMRGKGLGALLAHEAFAHALEAGAEKLTAQMTLDQKGAMSVFEHLGFSMEAMLKDHLKDQTGRRHDMVVLSHDVARVGARHAAFGLEEAF